MEDTYCLQCLYLDIILRLLDIPLEYSLCYFTTFLSLNEIYFSNKGGNIIVPSEIIELMMRIPKYRM